MNESAYILIIDDELPIRRLLEITLQSSGYDTLEALNGREGLSLAANRHPDLVILDLGLPDRSGHEVLRELREWYTRPVIILSVQNNEEDIVKALDNGANDYLIKPFRSGELLARIRSALRNFRVESGTGTLFQYGDIEWDSVARTIRIKGEPIKLTATEYKLLTLLMTHAGKVLTHPYLLKEVWGPGYLNQTQYLRVFIAQLRKKIEEDPNHPVYLHTESGIGYRFAITD